ncbi:MAG: ATP-binding protein [Spirochaetota bacterium]
MHYTLCDYLLDLFQNALEAGSTETSVHWEEDGNNVNLVVEDTGRGMTEQQLRRARDPFYTEPGKHPERRVGLGLPFLLQTVEATGGDIGIQSEPGEGTRIDCRLDLGHVDTPPVGDLADTFVQMCLYEGDYEVRITRRRGERSYSVSRGELTEALGELNSAASVSLLRRYMRGLEQELETMEV